MNLGHGIPFPDIEIFIHLGIDQQKWRNVGSRVKKTKKLQKMSEKSQQSNRRTGSRGTIRKLYYKSYYILIK